MIETSLNFFSEDIDFQITQPEILRSWVSSVIEEEGKSIELINFIFCSDEYLHQINVEYLNHDTLTDVITFPYTSNPIEGDIFISIKRVKENAKIFEVPFEEEIYRIMIHGVLHLIGYTDKSKETKQLMTTLENKYLQKLNVNQ